MGRQDVPSLMFQEKKRKDYAFRHQFIDKPSIIPGCPEMFQDIGDSFLVR